MYIKELKVCDNICLINRGDRKLLSITVRSLWYHGFYGSVYSINFRRHIFVSITYCVVFVFCLSSSCVHVCCQFLQIVHFVLALRYSLTFIQLPRYRRTPLYILYFLIECYIYLFIHSVLTMFLLNIYLLSFNRIRIIRWQFEYHYSQFFQQRSPLDQLVPSVQRVRGSILARDG